MGNVSVNGLNDANKKHAKSIAARAMINRLISNGSIIVPHGIALQIEHTFSLDSIFDKFKNYAFTAFQQVF